MKKLILAALLPVIMAGCYVAPEGVAYEVSASPPPPRYVVVEDRPGYVWVDGNWYWNSNRWLWNDGYYMVDRPGYVWTQGSYYGRRYNPGRWAPRSYYRPGPSQAGNAVRNGLRQDGGSRAGHYTAPIRSQPAPGRSQSAPRSSGRSSGGAGSYVRDHRGR